MALRIGEVAKRVGTTTRTIRYYEELGLLEPTAERTSGAHRTYSEESVERLARIVRLKQLLGVSLEELGSIIEHEDARPAIKAEVHAPETTPERRHALLVAAAANLDRQLELVRARSAELADLEADLVARRNRVEQALET